MATPVTSLVGDAATLNYSLDNSVFTPFAGILEINGNKITAAEVETTKLASAAVTKQAGIPNYGEIVLKIEFDKTITGTILGWMAAKTNLYFNVTINEGSSEAVPGFVKEFDPFGTLKENQRIESTITIAVSDAANFTPGT